MRNDNSTVATTASTETESFVNVDSDAALSVSVLPRNDVIGTDASVRTTEICVSIQARDLPDNEDESRAPVDIIVALDVSGSMRGTKLDLCKRTLNLLLRVLLPQDRFGLVSYSSDARLEIPARRMSPDHKQAALRTISALTANGGTNLSAAVGLAAQEMRLIDTPNDVRTIFFLTDGLANAGITHRDDLVDFARNCLGNHHGGWVVDFGEHLLLGPDLKVPPANEQSKKVAAAPISLHTFGFGRDHDAALLCKMASSSAGSYYFMENDKNVGSAFGDALGGVLSVVAQNAVVTIQVPPETLSLGAKIIEIFHDEAAARENGSYTVTVGDFYAQEKRDVVFQVKLATPSRSSPTNNHLPIPHAAISLAYSDTLDKCLVQTHDIVCTIVRPSGTEISRENPHVAAQWLRVSAAMEMQKAEKLAAQGRYAEAKWHMHLFRDTYSRQTAEVQDMSTALVHDVFQAERSLVDHNTYVRSGGAGMFLGSIRSHKTQRGSLASMDGMVAYENERKATFSSTFSTH